MHLFLSVCVWLILLITAVNFFLNFLLVIQWKFLMYVINFVPWRFEYGKSSWTCESSWLFLCVYLQDIVNVSSWIRCDEFCSFCGLDNLNRGLREGEMLQKVTIWPFLCIMNVYIMRKKKQNCTLGLQSKLCTFFLNEGLELNHSSQSLHALCSCWGALSGHICFLYTWSWLRLGAKPALITLESLPGREQASHDKVLAGIEMQLQRKQNSLCCSSPRNIPVIIHTRGFHQPDTSVLYRSFSSRAC